MSTEDYKKIDQGDDNMGAEAITRNFVYEMKVDKNSTKKEPTVGRDILEEAKKVLSKYKVK